LEKKAFFIPTPGQFEQEYLAKKYKKEGLLPYAKQERFQMGDVHSVNVYPGLPKLKSVTDWQELFGLFQGK
jgi:hypothetical protein